jgi:UDP-glucose 4-epimerase
LGGRTPKIRGDGDQTRDYVYVGDLVEAAAQAARKGGAGTWNLGTSIETSVNRLFALIAKGLNYPGEPEFVAQPPGEQLRSVLDGSAARRDFALPPYTPLEKGIPVTAEWFRKNRMRN